MKVVLQTSLLLLSLLFLKNKSCAQEQNRYTFEKKIALPGNGSYDYLFLDSAARRLYVSHGTAVHVIDLATETPVGMISGMQGNHGIAVAGDKGFISDGKANAVVVFNTNNFQTITTIPLSGKKPDAIIYDPASKTVLAFNGSSNNISVIDVDGLKEIRTISLPGAPEFAVSDAQGKIYNNLEDANKLQVIDTKEWKAVQSFALAPCGGPTGLALDSANNRLFTACRANKGLSVLDLKTGRVITTVPIGAGVDAVAYDPATKLVFCSNGDGTTTIIQQKTADQYEVVQTLQTTVRAKTLALDRQTHKIYLSAASFDAGTKEPLPNSFNVLVYKLTTDVK